MQIQSQMSHHNHKVQVLRYFYAGALLDRACALSILVVGHSAPLFVISKRPSTGIPALSRLSFVLRAQKMGFMTTTLCNWVGTVKSCRVMQCASLAGVIEVFFDSKRCRGYFKSHQSNMVVWDAPFFHDFFRAGGSWLVDHEELRSACYLPSSSILHPRPRISSMLTSTPMRYSPGSSQMSCL